MTTKDGFRWEAKTGLKGGLPCAGVVDGDQTASDLSSYDVIVVGAGFAGLVSSRDLALRGKKVLLLEARDRIGGRTWTSVSDGFPFEMGGAWIHWSQPHTYSQITRYNIQDEIKADFDTSGGINVADIHYHLGNDDVPMRMSHVEEDAIYQKPAELYFNLDGQMGRQLLPYPNLPFYNSEVLKYDGLTAFERIDQIRDQLTPLEIAALEAYLLLMSGGTAENSGFLDMLRWWALYDYGSHGAESSGMAYKLKNGTTGLAKHIFEDALKSGNLTFKHESPVTDIIDSSDFVTVTTEAGATFKSRTIVSTVPLNVLKSINFVPPLKSTKHAAIQKGHIGLHSKVHYEVRGQEYRSWSGYSYPGQGLLFAYGDEVTSSNTHIVAFGAASKPLHGSKDIQQTKNALLEIRDDLQIERIMFHDWVSDPYSQGSWCMFPKEFASKYLKALQERHGNVYFASADWADGWRGFIDGAIEQGAMIAQKVANDLETPVHKSSVIS